MSESTTAAVAAPEVKLPSTARIKRIEDIVLSDSTIKAALNKSDMTTVKNKDDSTKRVPTQIIKITQALIDDGKEPFTVVKAEVLKMANSILDLDGARTDIADEVAAAPKADKIEKAEKSDKLEVKAAKVDVADSREIKVELNKNLAIVSLLISCEQIAREDKKTGAEGRRKKLEEIRKEYISQAGITV